MATQEKTFPQPIIFEQSRLGGYIDINAADLPRTNADGEPIVELTPEQRYLFDTQGWLLIPNVLNSGQVEEMRDFCYRLHQQPESLPDHQRTPITGPLEKLTDHPVIVGFMNEFLAHPALSSQHCYGFRMEATHLAMRKHGDGPFAPHNGNGLLRLPGDSHIYRSIPGKACSSLTCVIWELNEVEHRGGGTLFIDGSHKATFPAPDGVTDPESPLWSSYACSAGSLVIFAEGTTHSALPWTSKERDRVAIFSRYNHVNSKFHDWDPHPDLVAAMPPKRQTLFRPVHVANNLVDSA